MEFIRSLFGKKKQQKAKLQDKIIESKKLKSNETGPAALLDSSDFQDKLYQNTCLTASDRRSVSEYSSEIYKYLRRVEVRISNQPYFSPRNGYLSSKHHSLTEKRVEVVDWMMATSQKLNFKRQTLYLAISLFDRYVELKPPEEESLSILSLTTLFIAYKYEEVAYLYREVMDLKTFQGKKHSQSEIYECELDVLVSLGWRLNHHGAMGFLDVLAKGMQLSPQAYHFAQYMVECLLFTGSAYCFPSSLIASAVLFLVLKIFKGETWSLELAACSLYTKSDVTTASDKIIECLKGEWVRLDGLCVGRKFAHVYFNQMSGLRDTVLKHLQ